MSILLIGPSSTRSKGGIATVIKEIEEDTKLCTEFGIETYESYIDGNIFIRVLFSFFSFIRFCLTKKGYDLYHIHMASWGSTWRKRLYFRKISRWGKKVIVHIHSGEFITFFEECPIRKQKKILDYLKNADMVIALSQEWKNIFVQKFSLVNCVVLENGINIAHLSKAKKPVEKNQNSFLALGRLGKLKGTADLVAAVELARKYNPSIKLYIVGDGEITKFKQLVCEKRLEDNIEIVGWVNQEEKVNLLSNVSTVILASYHEGLPMSILEGMACGKAIISTLVGAIPEVVKAENGILVEPGDIDAIAAAIVTCSTDTTMLNSMSVNNSKKAENSFDIMKMHNRLADYYEKILH